MVEKGECGLINSARNVSVCLCIQINYILEPYNLGAVLGRHPCLVAGVCCVQVSPLAGRPHVDFVVWKRVRCVCVCVCVRGEQGSYLRGMYTYLRTSG